MKNLFTLLLFTSVILFSGCETEDKNTDELGKSDGNISADGGILGFDGVFVWNKETEINFDDYYSQIDTIISEKFITRETKYYCGENETVYVKWNSNGYISEIKEHKAWKGNEQKWLVTSIATIDIGSISENLTLEAIVQFSDKNVRRFKTIPKITIRKNVYDALGCTFGTLRTEMNNIIRYDISPYFSSKGAGDLTPPHLFEFSNAKLIRLYSLQTNTGIYSGFLDTLHKCKLPEELTYENNTLHILNSQEWVVGNLKMKVFNTTLGKILNMEGQHGYDDEIICLTIEKL